MTAAGAEILAVAVVETALAEAAALAVVEAVAEASPQIKGFILGSLGCNLGLAILRRAISWSLPPSPRVRLVAALP